MKLFGRKKRKSTTHPPFDIKVEELIELSTDLFAIAHKKNGFFIHLNKVWTDTLGWSLEELYARPYIEFVHPDDRESTMKEVTSAQKMSEHFTNRYRCKDGTYRWLLWSSSVRGDLAYTVARDITRLKQQEILLKETSELAKIGGWSLNTSTLIVSLAEETFRMLGLPSGKTMTAEDCFQLFAEPYRATLLEASLLARKRGTPYDLELEYITPTGQSRWLRVICKPERNAEGVVHRVLGLCQDITERKLERISAMTTAKMASLGEMAGGIAHEINNPLAVIAMRTRHVKHLLEKPQPNIPAALDLLSVMDATVERIASIIRGLRFFARSGDRDPYEEIPIGNILRDTVALCRDRLVAAQVELTLEPGAEDMILECRPVQISQIVLNLLNNAIHAATKTPTPRWVSIHVEHDTDDLIRVRISNSGPRIPEDIRERIMEPFFTTKKLGEGTGLGLSISRGIAEEHGGRLFLDEESPRTTFVLELARHRARDEAP